MKPAPFRMLRPSTLEEVIAVLAEHGDEAKLLAGGQSLVPLMNLRMATPKLVVDLARVQELVGIADNGQRGIAIGSMTRQRQLEMWPELAMTSPMLHDALPHIGHITIRNRGTIGGSVAHADPAAELPTVLTALDARFIAQGPAGVRCLNGSELFEMVFTTRLEADEVLTAVHVPTTPPNVGEAWLEFAQRHGDFALIGVAVRLTVDDEGRSRDVRIVIAGAGGTPVDVPDVNEQAQQREPSAELFEEVAAHAARSCDPPSDLHATSDYRRRLIRVLTRRAARKAYRRTVEGD